MIILGYVVSKGEIKVNP